MRKKFSLLLFLSFFFVSLHAQDSVLHRVIFMGNAGEISPEQQSIINSAVGVVLPNKTIVMYLGENILPNGYGLTADKQAQSIKILDSQYKIFRSAGVPVYFTPGESDWDNGGPDGMEKLKLQSEHLSSQSDSGLQMLPTNGCPDPVEINISDSLSIIAFDSEWWLYQFDKSNDEADCNCTTKQEVVDALADLINHNRYKIILLVSHHPFQSQGVRGGHFSLRDNLFPLTVLNKYLFIPLPVVGSLYPLYMKIFNTPQDLNHPLYQKMINQVDALISGMPNVIHVGSHEAGMQFIKNKQTQVVTGIEGKRRFLKRNKHALYRESNPGFVTADLLPGNNLRFTYYVLHDTTVTVGYTYTQSFISYKQKEDSAIHQFDKDSILTPALAKFDSVTDLHRTLFGENYRKEWSLPAELPVIKLSEIKGGLIVVARGGGQQTHSLRLKDKQGNEWALRSVEKFPETILPEVLKNSFVKTILRDAISGENPYGSLMVPVLSDAEHIPHTNPIIGYVSPDTLLGAFNSQFANTICLLEEREPLGKSDNTFKMLDKLKSDNNNSVDDTTFLRARLLDLFIGDWDRHEGQWRWVDIDTGNGKKYIPVPKDRDQAFSLNEGFLPTIASRKWLQPKLRGFKPYIKALDYSFFNGKYLNGELLNQINYEEWMNITHKFVVALTDSVLEESIKRLPESVYNISHDELLMNMQFRRNNLEPAMKQYYLSLNKIVDIQCSNKDERIEIKDSADNSLSVSVYKSIADGSQLLYHRTFTPTVTHELRLYIYKGDDSLIINNKTSHIKLRIVGGGGKKHFNIITAKKKVNVYEKKSNSIVEGKKHRMIKHFSNDSLNTKYVPTNRYNVTLPLVTFGFNVDDGVLLGGGFKYIYQGFRKTPYAGIQQLTGAFAFSNQAFNIKYKGEWIRAVGRSDFILDANSYLPSKTQNYFGSGNETQFDAISEKKNYYKSRMNHFNFDPALRWKNKTGTSITIGPSLQYSKLDTSFDGALLRNTALIHTYDSTTLSNEKWHGGLVMNFINDKRSEALLPAWGSYINLRLLAYKGLNNYSKSFAQLSGEIDLYKSVNHRSTIIVVERIGGTVTVGHPAFYQTAFVGGRENLMGYHLNRFSGQHSLYNNVELRIKLADFASYIVPGQLGLIGFYDIGRVWEANETSVVWHNGYGGGIYFAPARIIVIRAEVAFSVEGYYPTVTLGFRY